MFKERGWSVYSKLLTFSGVLPLYGSKINYLISFIFMQLLIISILIFNGLSYWKIAKQTYGTTAENSESYQYFLNSGKQQIFYIWLYFNSQNIVNLLEKMNSLDEMMNRKSSSNIILKNIRINIISVIAFIINVTFIKYFNSQSWLEMFTSTYSLVLFTYEIDYVRVTPIMTLYTVLVSKTVDILKKINERLEILVNSKTEINSKNIKILLKVRSDLLVLCSVDISRNLGFSMFLVVSYLVIEFVRTPFFLTFDVTEDLEFEIKEKSFMIIWFSIKIIIFTRTLICNSVGKEVSFYI